MLIDPQLRQRILHTLRWLVRDAQYRFDDQKQNLDYGSQGGYSPELTEAITLLQDLEQGTMLLPVNKAQEFTEQQCRDAGFSIGMTEQQIEEYFVWYDEQGWAKGNGLPISSLTSSMRKWKLNQDKRNATHDTNSSNLKERMNTLQNKGLL